VKATIYACGRALERNPVIAREFTTRGHETAGHGCRWADHFRMSRDHERDQIQRAVTAIASATGPRPVGWYSRYAPSVHTRELLVEEGGFEYDSDSYADEIPYWVRVDDQPHLVIPYQLDANDAKFFRGPGWSGAGEFCEYLRDSVDYLRRGEKRHPACCPSGSTAGSSAGRVVRWPWSAFSSTVARCPTSGSLAGSISPAGGVSTTHPDP